MSKVQRKLNSKLCPLYVVTSDKALYGIFWNDQKLPKAQVGSKEEKLLDKVEKQITEYLLGKRKKFDVTLELEGTEFQKSVWRELLKIPYGETRSYKQIAEGVKKPKAFRAVGTANGRNPVSIIVPCHRVINEGGKMGGYAGGLNIKETLLSLEKTK